MVASMITPGCGGSMHPSGIPSRSSLCGLLMLVAALLVGAGASTSVQAQVTAQTLVGKAVSDDAQYGDINSAIGRFRERDINGCRAALERARSNNPKLPPPG